MRWSLIAVATTAQLRAAPAAPRLPCVDEHIVIEGDLPEEWASEVSKVCSELAAWPNTDPGARLTLRVVPVGLEVDAQLSDGRAARRHVPLPRDLRLTVEALLTLPAPETPPVAPVSAPSPAPRPTASAAYAERSTVGGGAAVELLGAATGRLSGAPGYVSVGVEGGAGLRAGKWVLGLVARWDGWQSPTAPAPPAFEMDTVGVGFVVARRLPVAESLHLDVGAETVLGIESQSINGVSGEVAGSTTDARFGLLGRLHWGASSLRGMLALEGELSPARLRRTLRIDDQLPALPAWTLGLAAGVSWSEP